MRVDVDEIYDAMSAFAFRARPCDRDEADDADQDLKQFRQANERSKTMLSTILLIIVAAVIAVLIYVATRPDAFKIERTTRISASPDRVFPLIADLHAFNTWNPFAKVGPDHQDRLSRCAERRRCGL